MADLSPDSGSCCGGGPGYKSPMDAYLNGPREQILYVSCLFPFASEGQGKDYLAVVDVEPSSSTYGQVINRCYAMYAGDEFHHFNWNTCSSCYNESHRKRDKLIAPCLNSDRIYVFDVQDERQPKVVKVIENLKEDFKVSAPHTVHCLPSGHVMVSCMGDADGNAKGSFVLLDGKTFNISGLWSEESTRFGYDFWYQPRQNVMVSSEWGAPVAWKKGLNFEDVQNGAYGRHLHFWNWTEKQIVQSIDLGNDGLTPLEVRIFHNPNCHEGFVGCALPSTIFEFEMDSEDKWSTTRVITVPPVKVQNHFLDEIPGVITDILISMDDRFLYFSNWLQGDVRQYDVSDPKSPKLVGQVYLGGLLCEDTSLTVVDENFVRPKRPVINGKPLRGGPQMVQLSLDGKRLYVTSSLYSAWDAQFHPELIKEGAMMVQIDVDTENGGLKLNEKFLVDFGQEPNGPVLAHEMRYPGGDCSSDIWL